ncbi:serine/threonine protein kinase [Spongiactinospora rosea]|uniref:non-specific serine/threonine protein kinase n=1 Tax=Spongiactinospora rosea TaxID=2248750 RepID=A0A366LLR9_9ACTN|nr:serine/threonine protein kinase [Spongiactinospora rosea]
MPGHTHLRELGSGGSGRVMLARRDADGVEVAIKYLSPQLLADADFAARFREEARLISMLGGPHIARLLDYVEGDGGAAIVMEPVDGVTLRRMIRERGATGPQAALVVLKGALLGLAAAHEAGVVHRDFKPENVLVTVAGDSKLVDFGIAVPAGAPEAVAGSPPYMAPELWEQAPASAATDVYAATIVFFECLTGRRPFDASDTAVLAHLHQSEPPPVDEAAEAVRGLLRHGLAKDPADRPPSAAAFLVELEETARDAYGPEWEREGRFGLGGLAALLIGFGVHAPPQLAAGSSLARTLLGTTGKAVIAGTLATVTVTGIIAGMAVLNGAQREATPPLAAPRTPAATSVASPPSALPEPSARESSPAEPPPLERWPSAEASLPIAVLPPPARPTAAEPSRPEPTRPEPSRPEPSAPETRKPREPQEPTPPPQQPEPQEPPQPQEPQPEEPRPTVTRPPAEPERPPERPPAEEREPRRHPNLRIEISASIRLPLLNGKKSPLLDSDLFLDLTTNLLGACVIPGSVLLGRGWARRRARNVRRTGRTGTD